MNARGIPPATQPPPLGWGRGLPTLAGGYLLCLGYTYPGLGGIPTPSRGQTDACENRTFPHPSDAGGKKGIVCCAVVGGFVITTNRKVHGLVLNRVNGWAKRGLKMQWSFEVFLWDHLIASGVGICYRQFGTLPIGIFRWFKFTLKPPYSGASEHSLLAIWDTSHWNFFVKFGLRTA